MSRMLSPNTQNIPTTWELIGEWEPKEPEHKVLFTTIRLDGRLPGKGFKMIDPIQDAKRETLTTSVGKIFGEGVRFYYEVRKKALRIAVGVRKKALRIAVGYTFANLDYKWLYYPIQESTGDFDWDLMRIHADLILRGIDP